VGQQPDPTGAKILDGAVRVLSDFGVRRATVELVAKYAGVSHMTIYRRWPSKGDLLRAAVVGEFASLLDDAFVGEPVDGEPSTSFAERTLDAFTDVVWALQGHPLVLRELGTESGEHSPLLSSASGAVMETSVPMIAERLEALATITAGAPAALDTIADVFTRLAHSLVVVKRPGQPLGSRAEVADYARECFGPYLLAQSGLTAHDAQVIDIAQRRPERIRRYRPHLQIAAASLLGAVTLGGGLAAALNGTITLPLITPAGVSESTAPASPSAPAPRGASEAQPSAGPEQPPEAVPAPVPVVSLPATVAVIPRVAPPPRTAVDIGSIGGSIGGDSVPDEVQVNPRVIPAAPKPAPQPPDPAPQPLEPAPPPPAPRPPGPQPPGPGPRPPAPGPKPPPPGPQQPGPKPPGPQQPGPGQKPPGPGPQQSGPQQSGPQQSGPQANRQPGPAN